jgi:branched-chain amino acid transport system permease protein
MEVFLQQLTNGIIMGSIYALLAMGLVLVMVVQRIANFAHGQYAMFGAFLCLFLMNQYSTNFFLSLIASFVVIAILAFVIAKLLLHPMVTGSIPFISAAIAMCALALIFDEVAAFTIGTDIHMVSSPFGAQTIIIGGVHLTLLRLLIPFIGAALIILLMLFIYKTKTGAALRAVAQDMRAASFLGIDVETIMIIGFIISCGLAAISGALIAQTRPIISLMGMPLSFKGFAIIIVGGITSLPGAILSSYILGIGESLIAGYVGPAWQDLFFFGGLFLILVIRPSGLLGRKVTL